MKTIANSSTITVAILAAVITSVINWVFFSFVGGSNDTSLEHEKTSNSKFTKLKDTNNTPFGGRENNYSLVLERLDNLTQQISTLNNVLSRLEEIETQVKKMRGEREEHSLENRLDNPVSKTQEQIEFDLDQRKQLSEQKWEEQKQLVENTFNTELVNNAWANDMEGRLSNFMASQNPEGTQSLVDMECRSSTCKLKLAQSDQGSIEDLHFELVNQMQGMFQASSVFHDEAGGWVMYLSKDSSFNANIDSF